MEFFELTQLLFNNHLLASEGTVSSVYDLYQQATKTNPEYIGLIKRPLGARKSEARVLKSGDKKVGVIPVKGALTYEETGWEALCGLSSYEAMQGNAEYMIKEAKVDEILLELNSGGGQAYGCFEAAQAVRDLANEYNVGITAYVDGVAFSGGYAWACIADKIIMNPMAKVGSIGVVLPLVNTAERDKKNGVKRIYVTSGKSKVPFDEDGNYTKEALEDMQKQSQEIYKMFVNHVASNRDISIEDVQDTEAKTFTANNALKLGLADEVMTKNEFYKHFEELYGEGIMQVNGKDTKEEVKTPALVTQLNENLSKVQADLVTANELVAQKNSEIENFKTDALAKDARIKELEQALSDQKASFDKLNTDIRRDKIKALVAEDEVESVLSIASDLSEDKFNVYLGTLQTKVQKSEKEMEELGDQGGNGGNELSLQEKMLARLKKQ